MGEWGPDDDAGVAVPIDITCEGDSVAEVVPIEEERVLALLR